ncbi:hypothetical protein [Labilithrix luteola]|nr:hypothetical protein [Labilithrix luteola]
MQRVGECVAAVRVALVSVTIAGTILTALAACSSSDDAVVAYPPGAGHPTDGTDDASEEDASAPGADDAARDATTPEPLVGTKLLAASVFLEGVTTDGHLAFFADADLMVLPSGASTPTTVVKDFHNDTDSWLVRGRFVAAWLGTAAKGPMTLWSSASGVVTAAPLTVRETLYPRGTSDSFAYFAPGTSALQDDLYATSAGAGPGTLVVANLDRGLLDSQCRRSVFFTPSALLVAGCVGADSTPRVATYDLGGGGVSNVVLQGSAPGVWLDHAATHAVVQTSAQSSIRALAGGGSPVVLDTSIRQAAFSADDSKVVYLRSDGAVRRASTASPASPINLATGAIQLLALSPDARFTAFATKGTPSNQDSDIVVVDANASSAAPRVLAADHAWVAGVSTSGSELVFFVPDDPPIQGTLSVASLGTGTTQTISTSAQRVVFDGRVLYWQEFVVAKKTNVLKAVRMSDRSNVIVVDEDLDPLTTQVMIAGSKLFVGNKLGLWSYPALAP